MHGNVVLAGVSANEPTRREFMTLRRVGLMLGLVTTVLSIAPVGADDDPLSVYEDWRTSPTIRSERWGGSIDSSQEVRREIRGHSLLMRLRKEGALGFDSGFTSAFHRLAFASPLSVNTVEADFTVKNIAVTACPTNPTFPSRVRAVQISLNKFNDGSSTAPGDLTGDHFGRIQVNRDGDSVDEDGLLRVQAFVFRCADRACANAVSVGPGVSFPNSVAVGDRFTLRLAWDRANNRFLAGVGMDPDAELPYPPAANVRPPGLAFSDIRINGIPANCTSAPTVTDAEIRVHQVRTNASAVIP